MQEVDVLDKETEEKYLFGIPSSDFVKILVTGIVSFSVLAYGALFSFQLATIKNVRVG